MRAGTRVAAIAGSALVVVALSIAAFVAARAEFQQRAGVEPTAAGDPLGVLTGPHISFRNTALGSEYGKLAVVRLDDPAGTRAYLDVSCERNYSTRVAGVCLQADRGVVTTYAVVNLDQSLAPTTSEPLTGTPSRTRMSPDGTLISTTSFVSGHSYAQLGFSTETIIRKDGRSLGNLENWTAVVDGRPLLAASRNFWGVTFAADGETFYVTAAVGETTWLMKGSISQRTMTSVRTEAECPSLSPDGTRVAYKKRLGNPTPGVWRLAVLDLASGTETLLSETRNVDDQMEWLDDENLLYALPRDGADATVTDVWSVSADGSGTPRLLVPEASSPAVVR